MSTRIGVAVLAVCFSAVIPISVASGQSAGQIAAQQLREQAVQNALKQRGINLPIRRYQGYSPYSYRSPYGQYRGYQSFRPSYGYGYSPYGYGYGYGYQAPIYYYRFPSSR